MLCDLIGYLGREAGARIVHGQDNTEHLKARVEDAAKETQGVAQLPEPLERVVLTLDRDQDGVRRGKAVHGQQAKGRWAVQ